MLGTDHRNISLNEFLDAHVKNGSRSRKDGERVPAFYHPADFPSGPDIVFVLCFDNHGYCPVFVQLKLRASMNLPDTQSAFDTVKAPAIQGHLGDAKLETFCTVSPKRYIGVVIAYPAELQGVEGSFFEPRRSGRLLAGQVEDAQCISLKIDRNNIHNLFPKAHMDLLNLLKGVKRDLGPDSDNLEDEHMAKKRWA
ncbi:hypothetical protein BGZ97_009374 [Linnemannia gamsii]|jgi:hypothetical protein|uniref:Uncharacterized protein n=1 Tax=Linnemannia gamsii TaxID=64522 RepID=A0A9P6QQ96_9FUNG|nr:hypothetical protein BGZ97_009374 [Linnemannia gamsii]